VGTGGDAKAAVAGKGVGAGGALHATSKVNAALTAMHDNDNLILSRRAVTMGNLAMLRV